MSYFPSWDKEEKKEQKNRKTADWAAFLNLWTVFRVCAVCLLCCQVAGKKLHKPLVGGALASPKLLMLGNAQTSLALRSLARKFNP
ncbi:MAG: hypothetical protein LBS03_00670 [Bacteroidales bacterium]|jgi:hypothetical protein|nr:hypothetical protein [Bacteroidales bacterium]